MREKSSSNGGSEHIKQKAQKEKMVFPIILFDMSSVH